MSTRQLESFSNKERLDAYNLITQGNYHVWSKGQMNEDKAVEFLNTLIPLTKHDPLFLAHLTSYVMDKSKSRDLQIFLTYVNSLSEGDGLPFSKGSKYNKPNYRQVSWAAVHHQSMNPKMALRLGELAQTKYGVDNFLNDAKHFPSSLKTALKKYLLYREQNIYVLEGAVKAGLGNRIKSMYRMLNMSPSDEAARVLRWNQRDREIEFESPYNFKDMDDLTIAKTIQSESIPVLTALGYLGSAGKSVSPAIAAALLEQSSPDQAVILTSTFDNAGVLEDEEVKALYEDKISKAKTALDRSTTLQKHASKEVQESLKKAKSKKRKEATKNIGKVFVHLDISGSMYNAIEGVKQLGSIIAECVDNPAENFGWAAFNDTPHNLPIPPEFTEDAFRHTLFGLTSGGGTNAFATYHLARQHGAEVDVFLSDTETWFSMAHQIETYHKNHNEPKPKACILIPIDRPDINVPGRDPITAGYEANGIPTAVIKPSSLTESALVVDAVEAAMKGKMKVIEEIMKHPLLELPDYYHAL